MVVVFMKHVLSYDTSVSYICMMCDYDYTCTNNLVCTIFFTNLLAFFKSFLLSKKLNLNIGPCA